METSYRSYGFVGVTKAVVLDVETTGLDPNVDRIISVAAIKVDLPEMARTGQAGAESFTCLLNPGCPIPAAATAVHGIEDGHVAGEECFADIAQQLRDFIGDLPIVGHNVQFDKRFLNAEFRRCKVKGLGRTKSYCTQQRTKEHFGHSGRGFRRVSLIEAAELFGVRGRRGKHHEALEDANICLQVAAGYYLVDNGLKQPPVLATKPERPHVAKSAVPSSFPWSAVILGVLLLFVVLSLIY
jgi:DNA polymerase III epsilon subunit family exonuclease